MRLNSCLTVLHVSVLMTSLHTLEADSEDANCLIEIQVHCNTIYGTSRGEHLGIECPVKFCNSSPPAVSWYKYEKTYVPIKVSSSSRIKTEWKNSNRLNGISYLIFQSVLVSDSGVYQCQSGNSVSHAINVSVYDNDESTVVTPAAITESPIIEDNVNDNVWPFVYRLIGLKVFVSIVMILHVRANSGCEGVCGAGRSKETLYQNCRASHDTSLIIHIYENDPDV